VVLIWRRVVVVGVSWMVEVLVIVIVVVARLCDEDEVVLLMVDVDLLEVVVVLLGDVVLLLEVALLDTVVMLVEVVVTGAGERVSLIRLQFHAHRYAQEIISLTCLSHNNLPLRLDLHHHDCRNILYASNALREPRLRHPNFRVEQQLVRPRLRPTILQSTALLNPAPLPRRPTSSSDVRI